MWKTALSQVARGPLFNVAPFGDHLKVSIFLLSFKPHFLIIFSYFFVQSFTYRIYPIIFHIFEFYF